LTIVGNGLSRRETEAAILSVPRFLVLSGPEHLGKRSFASSFLESVLDESDLLVAPPGPDGARESRSFLEDMPAFSPFRAVLVDDMDFLSEPAQDAWLKLCEEPPGRSCVIGIASDPGLLLPPLRSRIVREIRWSPLPESEIAELAASLGKPVDEVAVRMCCGIPGLYGTLCSSEYAALHESVSAAFDSPSFDSPTPSVLKSLGTDRGPERSAAAQVIRSAVRPFVDRPELRDGVVAFLRFSSVLLRVPAANAEIHWKNALVSLLKM
jgi:hypothetical protein